VGWFDNMVVNSSTANHSVHLPYSRIWRATPVGDGLLFSQMPSHSASDGHDHARAENLAHARALIELDHTKNL